jgi:hypothetical protein
VPVLTLSFKSDVTVRVKKGPRKTLQPMIPFAVFAVESM